jgi:hypothetical protein
MNWNIGYTETRLQDNTMQDTSCQEYTEQNQYGIIISWYMHAYHTLFYTQYSDVLQFCFVLVLPGFLDGTLEQTFLTSWTFIFEFSYAFCSDKNIYLY